MFMIMCIFTVRDAEHEWGHGDVGEIKCIQTAFAINSVASPCKSDIVVALERLGVTKKITVKCNEWLYV